MQKIPNSFFIKIGGLIAFAIFLSWAVKNPSSISSGFSNVFNILFPIILGIILAFLINLPMRAIETNLFGTKGGKLRRPVSYVLTILLLLFIFGLFIFIIIPQCVKSLESLASQIPSYFQNVSDSVETFVEKYMPSAEKYLDMLNINLNEVSDSLVNTLKQNAVQMLNVTFTNVFQVFSSVVSGTINFFLGFIFATYILLDKEHLISQTKGIFSAYLPQKVTTKIFSFFRLVNDTFSKFVTGQCFEALVIGFLFTAVMFVGRFDYAPLIGLLVGIGTLIPIFGAFISAAIGFLLILLSSGFGSAIVFVIVFLIFQQIDGNFIYPFIVGKSIGLPPVWILVAIVVGTSLFGLFGILFFIPLLSVIYTIFYKYTVGKLVKKGVMSPQPQGPPPPKKSRFKKLFKSSKK